MSAKCFVPIVVVLVLGFALAPAAWAAERGGAGLLEKVGVARGICVVLDDKDCRQALDLARASDLVLYVQLARAEDVEPARRAADAAGLYGTRIWVEGGALDRIHLADDLADAVLAPAGAPKAEVLRVLRPEGRALVGGEVVTKPFPAGVDDWSHHYHGPDNNPQSRDRLARAPYLTQFVAEPRYAPAPQSAVASGGRVFMALGNVAWHEREEPWMNTLVAVNGFNGTMLWRRPLKPGIMVDRSTMVATPGTLYLADDVSCKLLDAATGAVRGEITVPADQAGGTFWKWMALQDGVLYALVGEADAPDTDATWKSRGHGWPWDGISKGYNQPGYAWGFARSLFAIDPGTKKVLWRHREEAPIDSRALVMNSGRIFITHYTQYLACLDAKTGQEVWRRTAEKDPDLFKEIGPYRTDHGWIQGWKSTVSLKCTDKALYFVGPQVNWLTAVSADDGRFLWKYGAKDVHALLRDDGVYTIGCEGSKGLSKRLDPMTGAVLAEYDVARRACTRSTGSPDGILFRASGGSVRLDLATGKPQWISPMRPSCHVGVVIAAGHLYWVPWVCDCNLQMFGVISCAPAGDFAFGREATEAERLETGPGEASKVAPLDVSPDDWPAYRANNRLSAETRAAVSDKVRPLWQTKPAAAFEPTAPVAAGGLVFYGGSDGVVRALDADSGRERWKAYTGGAVRYPPTVADGRALVGSGDGWVYALEAATGRLLWRFRAAPAERKIAVYGALLSTWPLASDILVDGGVACFAAGLNNFDGTHVYALEAATGRIKWQNNTSGHLDAFSRRGVAAQGDLLLNDGRLFLAGGNSVSPGVYSVADGKCLNPPPTAPGSGAPRGRELVLQGNQVHVGGQPLYSRPEAPVFDGSVKWPDAVVRAKNANLACEERGGRWVLAARAPDGRELWTEPLPGEPVRWAVAVDARGRIAVTLRDGRVVCFGAKP